MAFFTLHGLEPHRRRPVFILMASAVLSVATGRVADAIVIVAVVAANAAIGAVTELRAEHTISSLFEMAEPEAAVIRDRSRRRISGDMVVPSDLLLRGRGDEVVADARLLSCDYLSVGEATLTPVRVSRSRSRCAPEYPNRRPSLNGSRSPAKNVPARARHGVPPASSAACFLRVRRTWYGDSAGAVD